MCDTEQDDKYFRFFRSNNEKDDMASFTFSFSKPILHSHKVIQCQRQGKKKLDVLINLYQWIITHILF